MKRKDFLKISASAAMFFGITPKTLANPSQLVEYLKPTFDNDGSCYELKDQAIEKVRVGIIGLGNRGSVLIQMFDYLIKNNLAEIVALSDLNENSIDKNVNYLKKIQKRKPYIYSDNINSWKKLVKRDDIDLIIIATPWDTHTEMCIYSMENDKHVACEVPIATSVEDCWKIVEVAESTKKHCMMMENCCFNNEELWLLNMIDNDVFGNINHAEGAYIHDLRKHLSR